MRYCIVQPDFLLCATTVPEPYSLVGTATDFLYNSYAICLNYFYSAKQLSQVLSISNI